MSSAIELYQQLSTAPDEKTRARLIAEAFERLEERCPEVKDLATSSGGWETARRLQKEIETVRKETVEAEVRLIKEIQSVRKEIAQAQSSTLRWLAITLVAVQTAIIIAAVFVISGK